MDAKDVRTIWLLHESELIREDCVRRFEKVGAQICPVKWGSGLPDMMRRLHRDDWVILDHQELERLGPNFGEAFKEVINIARVMVISPEALDVRVLHTGWATLSKPVNGATICAVVESLTGFRGCLEPGCCRHLRG